MHAFPAPRPSSNSDASSASPTRRTHRSTASLSGPPTIDGVTPHELVGKVLTSVRRARQHPLLTLHFSDNTTYQIKVEGYDPNPACQGVPKDLELSPSLEPLWDYCSGRELPPLAVKDCKLVTLTDKAFRSDPAALRSRSRRFSESALPSPLPSAGTEDRWDQKHLGLAFKFEELPTSGPIRERDAERADASTVRTPRAGSMWHCVWATMAEHDPELATCVFRSYGDVYLDRLQRNDKGSPRKRWSSGSQRPSWK